MVLLLECWLVVFRRRVCRCHGLVVVVIVVVVNAVVSLVWCALYT